MTKKLSVRPYGGRSSSARRSERREKLKTAGLELFGTKGLLETTIPELCAEAGVGIRAYYDEFGDKQTLLRVLYDQIVAGMFDRAQEEIVQGNLQGAVEAVLSTLMGDLRCGRVVCIESAGVSLELNRHRHIEMKRFVELTAQVFSETSQRVDRKVWSTMFAGGINELVIGQVVDPKPFDIHDLAKEILLFAKAD